MVKLKLVRTKDEVFRSINVIINYYDAFMKKNNDDKVTSKEELFDMIHEYYEWLQGKKT
jgi:hypothetical protein